MTTDRFRSELLAPGGSLEKALTAFEYGADAVYIGGQKYGLRSRATNFTFSEIQTLCHYANPLGKKVYVVINSFFHDEDFVGLKEFVKALEKFGVSALIISDLGVVSYIRKFSSLDIHLSTQASCVNSSAGLFWREQGVKRLILGREISIAEAGKIKKDTGLEVEIFCHGSMCMAYSGHCVISNYTSGRDSNRGGCAHSCRYEYQVKSQNESFSKTFLSSKDLSGINLIPEFHAHEIDSIKVEGRMKSTHYVGTVCNVYSRAINEFIINGDLNEFNGEKYVNELLKLPRRDYTEGSLVEKADIDSAFDEREYLEGNDYESVGFIKACDPEKGMIVEVRKRFSVEDNLEGLSSELGPLKFDSKNMRSLSGESLEKANPSTLVHLPFINGMKKLNLIRRRL